MIKQKAIILSISSDIAYAIALNLLKKNIKVFGTYRTVSNKTRSLKKKGAILFKLDLLKEKQINSVCNKIMNFAKDWNIFIGSAGTLEPIEKIIQSNNDKWQNSISINSLSQIIFLKNLLFNNKRKRKIIFFAGSGTNDATPYYSAYTLSKIILIKFVELLDSEEKLLNVVILGPGWVKTKIHKSTLNSKLKYLKNRKKTKEILV